MTTRAAGHHGALAVQQCDNGTELINATMLSQTFLENLSWGQQAAGDLHKQNL